MSITLDNALHLANEAKAYARKIILKGNTYHALDPNESKEKITHYRTGILDIRKSLVTLINAMIKAGVDKDLATHESRIAITKKFSLGNCHELAANALDYLINDAALKDINAELYYLHGGDHVFLVINRTEDSDASQPETWGENAVICDPWFDVVFPASEYKQKLKNHKRIESTSIITDFDPAHNQCIPILNHNFTYLRSAKATAIAKLTSNFNDLTEKSLAKLIDYHARLLKHERILAMRQNTEKRKLKAAAKIQAIDCQIKNMTSLIQTVATRIKHSEKEPIHESIKLANHTLINIRARVHSLLNQSFDSTPAPTTASSSNRYSR